MIENRIKVAKDKADLVRSLKASNNPTAPFQTYVEVMVFAAALGVKRKKRVPFEDFSKAEPAPIPREQFINNGSDMIIKLIAICETKEQEILAYEQKHNDRRNMIFEEYANGGFDVLQNELKGTIDYSDRIILFLSSERFGITSVDNNFDLSKFLV